MLTSFGNLILGLLSVFLVPLQVVVWHWYAALRSEGTLGWEE